MEKEIIFGGNKFVIDSRGTIKKITGGSDELYIPAVFPDGERVFLIGQACCNDFYDKVIIDDNIHSVEQGAFKDLCADELVWTSGCNYIPARCFQGSCIKRIFNIEHVTEIGEGAFAGTWIKRFTWPENCKKIPADCFRKSRLNFICKIENVEKIGRGAFRNTMLETINWPVACSVVPRECFAYSGLKSILGLKNVSRIEASAFRDTKDLNDVDLSSSFVIEVQRTAFAGINKDAVTFSYYISEDIIESAFSFSSKI